MTKRLIWALLVCAAVAASLVIGAKNEATVRSWLDTITAATGLSPRSLLAAKPSDLERWSLFDRGKQPEPILPPRAVIGALLPCVGSDDVFEACTSAREQLPRNAANALSDPVAMRNIAYCLKTGCAGAFVVAPANSCLWWALYVGAFKDRADSGDARLMQEACDAASFGTKDRWNAIVAEWTRAVQQP